MKKATADFKDQIHVLQPKWSSIKTTLRWSLNLTFVVLGLVGCSGKKEVSGQVFIRNGTSSEKLALVDIFVVDKRLLGEIAHPIVAQYFTSRAEVAVLKDLRNHIDRMRSKAPEKMHPKLDNVYKQVTDKLLGAIEDEGAYRSMLNHKLPPVTTKTDADGMFKVIASNTDLLVARKHRTSIDARDLCFWIHPVEKIEQNILFSDPEILKNDEGLVFALAEKAIPSVISLEKLEQLMRMEPPESLKQWAREQREVVWSVLQETEAKPK